MFDYRGRRVRRAGPATPVSIMGLNEVPVAGDSFEVLPSEREARAIVTERGQSKAKASEISMTGVTLEQLFDRFQAGEVKELRLIVKADVQGSIEPIINSLKDLNQEELKINILYQEIGNIGENDVMLAAASRAIVIGFNVQAEVAARKLAEAEGVSIRLYDIIYRLLEDIEKALKGMLAPEEKETVLGHAEVRAVFRISKVGNIAGCRVLDGEFRRNARARLTRKGTLVYEGEISSLKHLQEDVREVRAGFECGIGLKNFTDFQEGDVLECYILEKVQAI